MTDKLTPETPSTRLFRLVTGPGEDVYRAVDLLNIAHAMADVEAQLAADRKRLETPRGKAFGLVEAERDRQDAKWGPPSALPRHRTAERWFAILGEENGELAEAVTEVSAYIENGYEVPDEWKDALRKELVETAAVCLSWLEWLEEAALAAGEEKP